jgi:hypothetical protein
MSKRTKIWAAVRAAAGALSADPTVAVQTRSSTGRTLVFGTRAEESLPSPGASRDEGFEEALADIRARWAASGHKPRAELGAHYIADVSLLLDEVDRLRYEVDRKPR